MADVKKTLPPDTEIAILAAAYTVYCEIVENPISQNDFRTKYIENGHAFSDFVLGCTEK